MDASEVLLLAHRYQIADLVSLAKAHLLKNLSADTAVQTARAFRMLRDQSPEHQETWEQFCTQVAQNKSVVEALALKV